MSVGTPLQYRLVGQRMVVEYNMGVRLKKFSKLKMLIYSQNCLLVESKIRISFNRSLALLVPELPWPRRFGLVAVSCVLVHPRPLPNLHP